MRRLLVIALAVSAALLGLSVPSAYAATTISGRVTLTAGGPAPAGTTIVVRPAGGGAALASTVTDSATGAYSVSVTGSSVDVTVTAPAGSGWGQTVVADIDTSMDRTLDLQLAPSDAVTVSGVVRDGMDRPLSGTTLFLGTRTVTTDSNGAYTLTIAPGTHNLRVYRNSTATHAGFDTYSTIELNASRTLDITGVDPGWWTPG